MLGFLKIYFQQLLKIILVVAVIGIGLFLPLYAAIQLSAPPKILLEILWVVLPVIGFLTGVALPFFVEYRGRLTLRSFLGEVLSMLIALLFVGGGMFLGIALGIKGIDSFVTSDGTGLAVLFFLGSGAILGIIPGIILAALALTIWKRRNILRVDLT